MDDTADRFNPGQPVEVEGLKSELIPCLFVGASVSPLHPGGSHAVVNHNGGLGSIGIYPADALSPWYFKQQEEGQA